MFCPVCCHVLSSQCCFCLFLSMFGVFSAHGLHAVSFFIVVDVLRFIIHWYLLLCYCCEVFYNVMCDFFQLLFSLRLVLQNIIKFCFCCSLLVFFHDWVIFFYGHCHDNSIMQNFVFSNVLQYFLTVVSVHSLIECVPLVLRLVQWLVLAFIVVQFLD